MKNLLVLSFIVGVTALQAAQPHPLMGEYNRAWQLVGQQRGAEAIPLLKEIIAKDATFYRAYKTLAHAAVQEQRIDEVERYFKSLTQQNPGNGLASYGLGELSWYRKLYDAGTEQFTNCIRRVPEVHICYTELNATLQRSSKTAIPQAIEKQVSVHPRKPYQYFALATMLSFRLKLPEALKIAHAGLRMAESQDEAELLIAFEHLVIDLHGRTGDEANEALLHAQAALLLSKQLDDWGEQLDLTSVIGLIMLNTGRPDESRSYLTEALTRSQDLGHLPQIATSYERLGDYHARLGHHEEALHFYREAIAIHQKLQNSDRIVILRLYICNGYEARGDLGKAARCFEEYHRFAHGESHQWSEAFGLRRLGDVYRDSGEYFKALQVLAQAVAIFQKIGRRDNAGAALRVIASVHSALGNYASAIDFYQESMREAQAIHDAEQQERIEQGLGQLFLRMEDPRRALVHLEKALAVSERTHHADLRSRTLLFMGDAWRALRDNQRAASTLTEGLRIAREIHAKSFEAEALIGLGELNLKTRQLARADTLFQDGLELADQAGLAEVSLSAHRGLSESYATRGDYTQAIRHIELAVDAVDSIRGKIPVPDLKADFIQQNWKVYDLAIELLSRLHEVNPNPGYDRQAFYYAERGRARSFLDLLAESRTRITRGLTSNQLERQTSLLAAFATASTARLRQNSPENKRALDQAERGLTQWAAELRLNNPKYYNLHYPEPDDLEKVQSALAGTGIALLEYVLGERQSHLWIISEKKVRMTALPGRKLIEKEVGDFRELMAHRPTGKESLNDCQNAARRLYQLLVAPISGSLEGARRLLIVPDGILYYLPFEALIAPEGNRRYLIEEVPIAYVPSASIFGRLTADNRSARHRHPQDFLAFGDPLFGGDSRDTATTRLGDLVRGCA